MITIKVKAILFLSLLLIAYILHALLTAPEIASINSCLETSIHKIKLCPSNPSYISLNNIADIAQQAILVSEDQNFYVHKGFDLYEMLLSIKKDLMHLRLARGGSTISQQVVKNVFLSGEKTIHRKIQEAYLTYKLEKLLTKPQILELYLNLIELGPNLYGIKQASEFYFHKQPKNLTILESAYLAHLLPNPEKYSKLIKQSSIKSNRAMMLTICRKLWLGHYISAEQFISTEKLLDAFLLHPVEEYSVSNHRIS